MSLCVLDDSAVGSSLSIAQAIGCMEEAFRCHAAGNLAAPARMTCDLGAGDLAFTLGARTADDPVVGFRVYDLKQLKSPARSELVAVFDATEGALLGIVTGGLLGAIRTGAIGGVAVKYLANAKVKKLGMVGAGGQARTQLEAAVTVRDFESIEVYSRDQERRTRFATEMSAKLGCAVQAVGSAQAAVEDADVLLCTTTSTVPVVRAEWLKPGVHINNVGPKFSDGAELGLDVAERMGLLVTDTRSQMEAFGARFILHDTRFESSLRDLAPIVSGADPGPSSPDQSTLFYSLGLAGTEVLLAEFLFKDAASSASADERR